LSYYYFAFGLKIKTEIELPPLVALDSSVPDLVIRLGSVPHELDNALERGAYYEISSNSFLLKIEQVARYLVSNGNEIIVEPLPAADEKDVRLYLLGSSMGALLLQRGVWPLHGSAVANENEAALFVGDSGSGKSTLAGAFHKRGFHVLSDDVCALTAGEDGIIQVWPALPRIRLWSDSVVKLGGEPEQLTRAQTEIDKYEMGLKQFGHDPMPIKAVYALYTSDDLEAVDLIRLKGFDKIQELTTNTYRLHILTGMRLTSQHFQQAQALARQARVVRITRPRQLFLIEDLVDIIERDLEQ
jgi:hypothetical protein